MFENCLFKFLIGPDEDEFLVHSSIVSKLSPALDRLMNGSMRESHEKVARLPELDSKTFQNFLSYAYSFSSYEISNAEKDPPGKVYFTNSKMIEYLLLNDHTTFNCKGCGELCQLKFSTTFPRCRQCQCPYHIENPLDWRSQCVVGKCSSEAKRLEGLICSECYDQSGIFDLEMANSEDLGLELPRKLEELTKFHFEIPLRAKELAQLTYESTRRPHLACTDLLGIGKLAIFAHIYDVPALFEATALELYKSLAMQNFQKEDLESVVELARTVYSGTMGLEGQDARKTNVLRRMISGYIATHHVHFMSSHFLDALLDLGKETVRDIMTAVGKSNG